MKITVSKIFDPQVWQRVAERTHRHVYENRLRKRLHKIYDALGPVSADGGSMAIVADGLWDNANHFFRLRLFLEAQPDIASYKLIAMVRTRNDRTIETLKTIGFNQFVMIEEEPAYDIEEYLERARGMLASVNTHWDLLNLELPDGLPAYTYYDTVLKLARHPHPPLGSSLWESALAECLRYCAIYDDLFKNETVVQVVLSHPWKSEYAALFWMALKRDVPAYHVTGYCDGIRIRFFGSTDDYSTPVETLELEEYLDLPEPVQRKLVEEGRQYISQRESGLSSDINVQYAFHPEKRSNTKLAARTALNVRPERKLGVVYSHVGFDFPHIFTMKNFTDFFDWMKLTIETIREFDDMDWLIKPHPAESWFGGFALTDMLEELPSHVYASPPDTDSLTALVAADVVVTVHGTVCMEATVHGVPVIAADRGPHSGWGFVHQAESREHYVELLKLAHTLSSANETERERACALIAISRAPVPREFGTLNLYCDSTGPKMYKEIIHHYITNREGINQERENICTWLDEGSSSYAATIKINHYISQTRDSLP